MKKKVAKMWVDALRSKKYRKTTGALKVIKNDEVKLSALGVLCDLYNKTHKNKLKEVPADSVDSVRKGWRLVSIEGLWDNGCRRGLYNRPGLPEKVRKWAGIKDHQCKFMIPEKGVHLFKFPHMDLPYTIAKLNDVEVGWNFKKIAEIIDIVYEKL